MVIAHYVDITRKWVKTRAGNEPRHGSKFSWSDDGGMWQSTVEHKLILKSGGKDAASGKLLPRHVLCVLSPAVRV